MTALSRISEQVYSKTEQHRFSCECKETARRFYRSGYEDWKEYLAGVTAKRGTEASDRLKKGVEWLWQKHEEKLKGLKYE